MPTVAERYKFLEVDSDVKTFISELLEQCKGHHVAREGREAGEHHSSWKQRCDCQATRACTGVD